ncbi:DUF192 domain-containing protein [Candidatus Woesearchaeota archaeon]|nr:DUF192 domain-containing protein [Candidatus Woesearchaeota archaeon]
MGRIKPATLVFVWKTPIIVRLHMLFVFFPIDIILLNASHHVIEVRECFKPFSLFTSKKPAVACIECPVGTIKIAQVRIGDKLSIL